MTAERVHRPPETLERGELCLRRRRAEDAGWAYDLVMEAYDHLLPYLPWVEGYDRDRARTFLETCEQEWAAGLAFQYSLRHRGLPAGSVSLMPRQETGTGTAEIGYWLHPAHTGRGLMTESVRALVEAGFALPGLGTVEILHDAGNRASEAVPRRLGFIRVGHRRSRPPLPRADSGTEVIWRLHRDQAPVSSSGSGPPP